MINSGYRTDEISFPISLRGCTSGVQSWGHRGVLEWYVLYCTYLCLVRAPLNLGAQCLPWRPLWRVAVLDSKSRALFLFFCLMCPPTRFLSSMLFLGKLYNTRKGYARS